MDEIFNLHQLQEMAPDSAGDDILARKYAGWEALNKDDEQQLLRIGLLTSGNQSGDTTDVNYWHPRSPITFSSYPYDGCWIYKSKNYPTYYLVYTEFGGHVPELRCRYFDKKLVVHA